MLQWDVEVKKKTTRKVVKTSRLRDEAREEAESQFVQYNPAHDGTMGLEELSLKMANFHGVSEREMRDVLESALVEPEDPVDAAAYVDAFQQLAAGDEALYDFVLEDASRPGSSARTRRPSRVGPNAATLAQQVTLGNLMSFRSLGAVGAADVDPELAAAVEATY